MAVSSVLSSSDTSAAVDATSATASAASKTSMDKESFLKLLVAQISHQDPLKPMEGTAFVSQLSQFSMIEQAITQTSKLDTLSLQMKGIANNDAAALVGKSVSIRGSGFSFDGTTPTDSAVTLDAAAAKVTAKIVDKDGNVVRTMDLGARSSGSVPVAWDGRDEHGSMSAAGKYQLKVEATATDGTPVGASQIVAGLVSKITYDKGYPTIVLDSGTSAAISDLVSVNEAPAVPAK